MSDPWCSPDDCPSTICNGPHVNHTCPNGDIVTSLIGDSTPCPFCGWVPDVGSTSADFDTGTDLTPEQYVIKALRIRLLHSRDGWDSNTQFARGAKSAYTLAVQTLNDLCRSQGVTL